MKTSMWKKFICMSLVLAMLCTVLSIYPVSADAKENYVNILHKVSTTEGNVPINYNFSLSRNSDIFFIIRTNERAGVTINIKEPGHDIPKATITMPESNPEWQYIRESGIYQNRAGINLTAGKYILEVQFSIGVNFDLSMNQMALVAKLNKTATTITKGFSETLKVNSGSIARCSSSNKSVATVNNKGKITARKNGNAKIKVKLKNGTILSCKVRVVSNKYHAKKITVDNTVYNSYAMKAYDAKFDSKGNLVVKHTIVNNSYGKLEKIPKFKVTIRDSKKKIVGSYKKSIYRVNVPSYQAKNYTIIIPKSSLKNHIDIRTSTISITGKMADSSI